MTTVYATIGNSDDKLSQREWAAFVADVRRVLAEEAETTHGEWFSAPDTPWQNACWCVEIPAYRLARARHRVGKLAPVYRQESIAWAEVAAVEMLGVAQ